MSSSAGFFSSFLASFAGYLPPFAAGFPPLAAAAAAGHDYLIWAENLETRQNQANVCGWVAVLKAYDWSASHASLSADDGIYPPIHCCVFKVPSIVLISTILMIFI